MNIKWPQKDKNLFIEYGKYYEYSHYGWGDIHVQFSGYILGYKNAADLLVRRMNRVKDISYSDTIVYPVIFLYRQYLELQIKYIFCYFVEKPINEKEKILNKYGHDLLKMWREIKDTLLEDVSDSEKEDIENVEKYIDQYNEFDKTSFKYRYPIDKNVNPVNQKTIRINLNHLRNCIDELDSFFGAAISFISANKDFKIEMANELFSEYSY
jgi:hypothetical protein